MRYLHQIDFIKCFAIISVIVLHSVPMEILVETYSVYYIWQAVPLFVILMGFNLSSSRNRPLYTSDYFSKRYKRIIEPFLIVFIISLVFGLIFYREELYIGWLNLIGLMPKSGAGNYYVTLLIQFILLAPILFWAYKKRPKITIVLLFLIDIAFQVITWKFNLFSDNQYLYNSSIIRYLSALGIGMWIAKDFRIKSKRNYWILCGSVLSIIYLAIGNYSSLFFFDEGWRTQNVLSFFYPALLVLCALNFLPNKIDTPLLKGSSQIGKASYHIFLIQMIYFALVPTNSFALELSTKYNYYIVGAGLVFLNLIVCLTAGLLFYKLEITIRKIKSDRINTKNLKAS